MRLEYGIDGVADYQADIEAKQRLPVSGAVFDRQVNERAEDEGEPAEIGQNENAKERSLPVQVGNEAVGMPPFAIEKKIDDSEQRDGGQTA